MARQYKKKIATYIVKESPLTHDRLPDTYRSNEICPRCGKQSTFEAIGELPVTFNGAMVHPSDARKSYPDYSDKVTCMICRHSNQGVVVLEEKWIGSHPSRLVMSNGGEIIFRGIH